MTKQNSDSNRNSNSFTVGAIALVFLAIGYQTALFIHKATVAEVVRNKDNPDTVYVYRSVQSYTNKEEYTDFSINTGPDTDKYHRETPQKSKRINSPHSQSAMNIREKYAKRRYESFRFDPNTVSVEDLERLGFSEKQAGAIDNYRKSGGRFARKEDFAKSFVVADSVYQRLESFIDIPKLDINRADSTAFDALPGIGPYFAAKMVSYRQSLGGYSIIGQLTEIYNFGQERFERIKDLVTVGNAPEYRLWELDEDSLALHPYINRHSAHGIVLFRNNNPKELWTIEELVKAGVVDSTNGGKLSQCQIKKP